MDVGTVFVVELDPIDADVVRLRRIRSSYAGVLSGVGASAKPTLEAEREGWS
jgi:hypothetical protein